MQKIGLDMFLRRRVVLDTPGPLIYIGELEAHDERGYWLTNADVHDRNDGHSGKEAYISDAHQLEKTGSRRVNRRRVFVERHVVASISALDDVVMEDQPANNENDEAWSP